MPDDGMDAARMAMEDREAKDYYAKTKGEAGGESTADAAGFFQMLREQCVAQPSCPHCGRPIVHTEDASWKQAYIKERSEVARLEACLATCRASLAEAEPDIAPYTGEPPHTD